jgi:chlorite dismutase
MIHKMITPAPNQFVKYTFYRIDPAWRLLPAEERRAATDRFLISLAEFERHLTVRTYTLMGLRADAELMIWCVGFSLDFIQQFATEIASTELGAYLQTTYSYLAMTRRSIYLDDHSHPTDGDRTRIRPMDRPYLVVYPFVKTHSWYQLSGDERQRLMGEHFRVGHKYPEVRIHTAYSYGLDDQDFVLGFETDDLEKFLELVMELRSSEQRPYTERDTPIFTCILKDPREAVSSLGGR